MAKKDNTVLYLVIAAAVVGYFVFKNGGVLNQSAAAVPPGTYPAPAVSSPAGIALEQPTPEDIGIIAPHLDPTGMQITFN